MMRLKNSKNLDTKQETAVENAYYSCKPPERAAIRVKERTPLELYLRKLIYEDLTEKNKRSVMDKLRKLDWEKHEVWFLKNWIFKFKNFHFFSIFPPVLLMRGALLASSFALPLPTPSLLAPCSALSSPNPIT
jgi:regulator of nonsense transcripts 2